MSARDWRIKVILVLVVVALTLHFYRTNALRRMERAATGSGLFSTEPAEPTAERVRSMIDTTARMLGAQKKFIARHMVVDSGGVVPELRIGVPSAFDELRLITALTDSLRPASYSVSAQKSLREKTTVVRITNRSHECMYRCLLYRKELSH